jgi:hypothetical protein
MKKIQISSQIFVTIFCPFVTSVADSDPFDTDPDPAFHFNTDPDLAFQSDTDPDPYRFKEVKYIKQSFLYIFT